MKKLENKVSIITGAGSGMGKAISILFAAEGSKVIAADINQERLDALKKEVSESGGELTTVLTNVAKEEDIENMIKMATTKYGTLDILVNNAGVMDNFGPVKIFLEKKSGVIINICSIGGIKGGVAGAAYTTSKHALVGLTKSTGYLYSKSGIRCNGIAPGAVNTNIAETIDMTKITPLVNDRIMSGMALNPRTGESPEIAKAALFLACDDSSFVNGEILVVDGGWSAY